MARPPPFEWMRIRTHCKFLCNKRRGRGRVRRRCARRTRSDRRDRRGTAWRAPAVIAAVAAAPCAAPGPPPNASIALLALEVGRLQTQMQRQDAALAELRAQVRELRAALDREK